MNISAAGLIEFAEAALAADYSRLRRAGQGIAGELEKTHPDEARRFRLALNRKGVPLQASGFTEMLPVDGKSRLPLVEEHEWPTTPAFLDAASRERFVFFLEDASNFELLASSGVASRLSLLLSGPPGTGKTLLAGHVAAKLGRRLYVVRLDSLISSMLGDTAKNIRSVFDFVAGKNAVLFLDELDALAKMRDDRNELGELKRVVNTVLQGIDSLDANAVVVAATNHAQILDSAVWRRFSYKIEFAPPDIDLREALWMHFLGDEPQHQLASRILAFLSEGLSGADIEQHALAARRKAILAGTDLDTVSLANSLISSIGEGAGERQGPATDGRRRAANVLVGIHKVPQKDVATFLGVTRQSVSAYLKG